jgi:hypothetical protein
MRPYHQSVRAGTHQMRASTTDNSLLDLNAILEFVKDSLAEKLTKNDELTSPNFELESEKSLLKLDNDNLKKEAEDSQKELERLKQSILLAVLKFLILLCSKQKSTKLAEEQVEALSEALAALQEAVKHTNDAAKATKTESESMNSLATKTEAERKKRTWIGKQLDKRKTRTESHSTKMGIREYAGNNRNQDGGKGQKSPRSISEQHKSKRQSAEKRKLKHFHGNNSMTQFILICYYDLKRNLYC